MKKQRKFMQSKILNKTTKSNINIAAFTNNIRVNPTSIIANRYLQLTVLFFFFLTISSNNTFLFKSILHACYSFSFFLFASFSLKYSVCTEQFIVSCFLFFLMCANWSKTMRLNVNYEFSQLHSICIHVYSHSYSSGFY